MSDKTKMIACCGLYCAECPNHKGIIADLARDLRKELEGCWLCDEFETCKKLDELRANHGIAHIKNLRRIKRKGIDEFLSGKKLWYANQAVRIRHQGRQKRFPYLAS